MEQASFPTSFPEFLDSLRLSGSVALSPTAVSDALQVQAQDLATLAHVHRNTLSGSPTSAKLQAALRDIVRVLSVAHSFSGDFNKAIFWFRNHRIADFGHQTPMQLVERGKAQSVIDYVESLEAGASGNDYVRDSCPIRVLPRSHPKWASQPLSGAGAAKQGGRLNRPGVHALYLAAHANTALGEYTQKEMLMPPSTLVAYRVCLGSVVDFRSGFDPAHWTSEWQDLTCNWREDALLHRVDPPSRDLADFAISKGHRGILYPSQLVVGGVNLVVFLDHLKDGDAISVHDPDNSLPSDASSWK